MGYVIGVILLILFFALCIALYAIIIGGALWVGAIGGFFIGVFKGLRNYFASLFQNVGRGK